MVATVRNLTSASATADYLRRDGGYYTAAGEKSDEGRAKNAEHRNGSFWHGSGALALGLRPDLHVAAGKFESLLAGHVIGSGIRLGRMRSGKREHRPGLDITFSAPKSVSLAALLPTRRHPHGDRGVVHAHDEAVRATLDWVEESLLETRGWDPDTRTRPRIKAPHMVAATFRHVASRNLDPQLHTHAVIANMTRDGEGRWRSIEATLLHRHARQIGAYYRNELSRRLMERGYDVRPAMAGRMPSFEIAGYDRRLRNAFSTRRSEIIDYMRQKGWDHSQAAAQMATLATRRRKDEPLRAMLETVWAERAQALGLAADLAAARPCRPLRPAEDLSALAIVARMAERLEERQSVFAAHDLETLALAHSPGRHTLDAIRQAMGELVRDGHLVEASLWRADRAFVTDRTLKAERAVIAMMKASIGDAETLASDDDVAARLADSGLTEGQREAVRTILLSDDTIVGVQGRAGTGKTTMLREVRALAGEERRIIGLAPSAAASRVLEREAGIHARTLQWFLTRCRAADVEDPDAAPESLRDLFGGSVVVLDEASMVSTEQMRSLMRIAKNLDIARLVMVGDTGQLRPVDAGQPFRQLQQAGMTTALMSDIRRQRSPDLKAAVLAVLEGEPGAAVRLLSAGLVEVDHDDLAEKAARAWLELDGQARARTLLLAPTHALRAEINRVVREGLGAEGVLHGPVLQLERLVGLGMTRAEKADVRNYAEGDVVVFHQDLVNYRVKADDACTVTGIEGDHVLLSHPDGKPRRIAPEGNIRYRLEVYESRPIELQAGDRIRWTRNDKARALVNGEVAEIVAITGKRVRLLTADGAELSLKHDDPQLRHIDHAWSSTVHGAQGSTADGVIAVLDSGHGLLTDQATFYVEISRARDSVMVLTDNGEQLIETLEANTGKRATALEAIGVTSDALQDFLPEKSLRRRGQEMAAAERRHEEAVGARPGEGEREAETDGGEGGEVRDHRHDIAAAAPIEVLHHEAERLLHVRGGLVEQAVGESSPIVETAGHANWLAAVSRVEAAWQEMTDDGDAGGVLAARPEVSRAITACLGTLRAARLCDEASSRFEALRREIDERAAAEGTIQSLVDGHDDLLRQARQLAAMKNAPATERASARAVIIDEVKTQDRREKVLALAAEAERLLDSHQRLADRHPERPGSEPAGHAAWRERWLKARRQLRAMQRRPDLWQPHLERHAGDLKERLERCESLAASDAAWARFAAARHRIEERARGAELSPFGMAGWHGLVAQARALLLRDDLPEAAALEAQDVLTTDAEGRACRDTIRRFLGDAREHTRRWRILDADARERTREGRNTVVTDLEGYREFAARARELAATGSTLLRDERYRHHLDRVAARRIEKALEKLDRHEPFDRFLEATRDLKKLGRQARRDGVPAFHAEGYGAVFDAVQKLAGDRALPAAARRRLRPVFEEHARCTQECARIEAQEQALAQLDREHRALGERAGRDDLPITLLDEWPRWQEKAAAWHDGAQELLDLDRFARHLRCLPAVEERIEAGLAAVAMRLAAPALDRDRIAGLVRDEAARLRARPPGGAFAIAWHGKTQLVAGDRLRRQLARDGSVQELVVVWPGNSGGRNPDDALLVEHVGTERNADGSGKERVESVKCKDLGDDQVHRATWRDERLRDAAAARERSASSGVHRIACHRNVVAGDRLRWTVVPDPAIRSPGRGDIDPGAARDPQSLEGVLLRIVAGKTSAEDLCTVHVERVDGRQNAFEMEMERRQLLGRGCYRAPWVDENERSRTMRGQTADLREQRHMLQRRGPHLSMRL